jgi:hypothetical protein
MYAYAYAPQVKEEVPIPLKIFGFQHFLRPANINEQQFGANWGGHACERRLEVRDPAIQSIDSYVNKVLCLGYWSCIHVCVSASDL